MLIESDQEPKPNDTTETVSGDKNCEPSPSTPPTSFPAQTPPTTKDEADPYKEKNHRLNKRQFWIGLITLIVLALYTAIAGYQAWKMRQSTDAAVVSANAAKDSVDLARKQMEGIGAAIVELPRGISVDFPAPPHGEIRANPINSGHVNGHDIHLVFSATTNDAKTKATERLILSRAENIPVLAPSAIATRPDFIYQFELSGAEYRKILITDSYITVKGAFDYENGFGTRLKEPFCYAYLWGPQRFGRWTGNCDQVETEVSAAKRYKPK